MQTYAIPYCGSDSNACMTIHEHLIWSGYFAASPSLPNTAFSIDVLESYLIPNRHTTYSVAPFCLGLVAALIRHGYQFKAKIPFRNQLPEAIIWFNALKHKVQISEGEIIMAAEGQMNHDHTPIRAGPSSSTSDHQPTTMLAGDGLAHSRLHQLCPACFGGRSWGGLPEINPDVHVAIDVNFTH